MWFTLRRRDMSVSRNSFACYYAQHLRIIIDVRLHLGAPYGMSADAVRGLLGTPDYADTETCLSYLIAQPFDEVTLDLTLENGIVTKVEEKDH